MKSRNICRKIYPEWVYSVWEMKQINVFGKTQSLSNMNRTNDQATLFQNDSSKKLFTPPSRYRELTDIAALNSPSYPH